jgi:hypothetical protein
MRFICPQRACKLRQVSFSSCQLFPLFFLAFIFCSLVHASTENKRVVDYRIWRRFFVSIAIFTHYFPILLLTFPKSSHSIYYLKSRAELALEFLLDVPRNCRRLLKSKPDICAEGCLFGRQSVEANCFGRNLSIYNVLLRI